MRNNQDTPLIVRSIRRVRKGVYAVWLRHPSRRPYNQGLPEYFYGATIHEARAMCRRMYPSVIFPGKAKTLESNDA